MQQKIVVLLATLVFCITACQDKKSDSSTTGETDTTNALVEKELRSLSPALKSIWLESAAVTLTEAKQTPRQISLDSADMFIEQYGEMLKTQVPSINENGVLSTRLLRDMLHEGLCKDCPDPGAALPSYTIGKDAIGQIFKDGRVTHLRIYPAMRLEKVGDKTKRFFTLVLVGASASGDAVLGNKVRRGTGAAQAADNQIWEYIEPCPPPRGCQNIQ